MPRRRCRCSPQHRRLPSPRPLLFVATHPSVHPLRHRLSLSREPPPNPPSQSHQSPTVLRWLPHRSWVARLRMLRRTWPRAQIKAWPRVRPLPLPRCLVRKTQIRSQPTLRLVPWKSPQRMFFPSLRLPRRLPKKRTQFLRRASPRHPRSFLQSVPRWMKRPSMLRLTTALRERWTSRSLSPPRSGLLLPHDLPPRDLSLPRPRCPFDPAPRGLPSAQHRPACPRRQPPAFDWTRVCCPHAIRLAPQLPSLPAPRLLCRPVCVAPGRHREAWLRSSRPRHSPLRPSWAVPWLMPPLRLRRGLPHRGSPSSSVSCFLVAVLPISTHRPVAGHSTPVYPG